MSQLQRMNSKVHFYISHLKEVQRKRPKAIMDVYYNKLINQKFPFDSKKELLRKKKIEAILNTFPEELL